MIIIGEKINGSIPVVAKAIAERDAEFIMFQETMGLWEMILELHAVITEAEPGNLSYLHRLQ